MWRSGWLGIDAYGERTHGFADLDRGRDGTSKAEIHWLAPTGEVHSPIRLRHDPVSGTVELLANFGDAFEPDDEFDSEPDDDASGWSVEDTTPVPADLARLLAVDALLAQVFTVMASLHPGMFSVLDDGAEVGWDHHWLPGPGPDELWRPVDLGPESHPVPARSSSADVEPRALDTAENAENAFPGGSGPMS